MGRRSAKANQPHSISVSTAFADIPKEESYIWREALAAIDRVHGDGRLPSARLQWDEVLPEDFKSVGVALETLFRKKGWMR